MYVMINQKKGNKSFFKTHGMSRTTIYARWRSMKDRVKKEWHGSDRYYDRGITVCDEWQKFEAFYEWAMDNGYSDKLELDRIDNDKGYYPDNCRYVTRRINSLNTSKTIIVEYDGEKLALAFLCDKLGFDRHQTNTIRTRLKRGYDLDKALNKPFRKY